MPDYQVNLYYTGFITRPVQAESEEDAIHKARSEQDAPLNRRAFLKSFKPILETLEPWKDCDTARLKAGDTSITSHPYPKSDRCPECGERTHWVGGCPFCPFCGWSPCG